MCSTSVLAIRPTDVQGYLRVLPHSNPQARASVELLPPLPFRLLDQEDIRLGEDLQELIELIVRHGEEAGALGLDPGYPPIEVIQIPEFLAQDLDLLLDSCLAAGGRLLVPRVLTAGLLQSIEDGVGHLSGIGRALQIRGPDLRLAEHLLDSRDHSRSGVFVPEVIEHHRAGPDLAYRVRDSLSGYVRGGAVDRLEHRRVLALRVEVGRGGYPDAASDRRAQVAQDVAEEVGAHHHVKARRLEHEGRREGVYVILAGLDVRVLAGHFVEDLVPERHRVDDAVGLRRRGHAALAAFSQRESELYGPAHAPAGEDRLLNGDLVRGTTVQPAADLRVLSLVVLAYHDEVYVLGSYLRERTPYAFKELHGPQVDVLLEGAPDRYE